MNRLPNEVFPSTAESKTAVAPSKPTLYWLRVGLLAFAILALPLCAIFLPNVKEAVAKSTAAFDARIKERDDESNEISSRADASVASSETSSEKPLERTSEKPREPSFTALLDEEFAALEKISPRFDEVRSSVDEPSGVAQVAFVARSSAAAQNFSSIRNVPPPQNFSCDAETERLATRLQDALNARGVEAVRIERWGDRFWRASGRAPFDSKTGVSEFFEAIGDDATSAARALLEQIAAKTSIR